MKYFEITLENSGDKVYISAETAFEIEQVMFKYLIKQSITGEINEPTSAIQLTKKKRLLLGIKKMKEPGVIKVVKNES